MFIFIKFPTVLLAGYLALTN